MTEPMSHSERQDRERTLGIHYDDPPLVIRSIAQINELVAFLEATSDDDEHAHWLRDQIAIATLRAIADGATNPNELAATALKADEIEFSRWYA